MAKLSEKDTALIEKMINSVADVPDQTDSGHSLREAKVLARRALDRARTSVTALLLQTKG